MAVDWSGALRPTGRIWVGVARAGRLRELYAAATRQLAVEDIVARGRGARGPLVVGLDFCFSMPAWFVRQHGLSTARQLWQLVASEGEQWLAQCAPPFWGRPGRRRPDLEADFRRTELDCAPVGGIRPKSVFQIGGAGAVGSSSLRGMPYLSTLHDAGFVIWPFDAATDRTVFEIYPRLCTGPVTKSDLSARRGVLERYTASGAMDERLASVAAATEDAFDAAISAVVMSRHQAELAALPAASDEIVRLEGAIAPVHPAR